MTAATSGFYSNLTEINEFHFRFRATCLAKRILVEMVLKFAHISLQV